MARSIPIETRFAGRRRRDEAAFRHLVALTFPIFLVAALLRGALVVSGLIRGDGTHQSLIGRARSMAHTVIPYCFMG